MRNQLGILVCLLAGCAAQPTVSRPPLAATSGAHDHGLGFVLRIGIEHLPPDAATAGATIEPVVEPQPRPAPAVAAPAPRTNERERPREPEAAHRHAWSMSIGDLAAIDDPIARETLHFVQDLIDADLERSRRDVTPPMLGMPGELPGGPLLRSEEELLAAQEEWLQERGPSLMRRPLRCMWRRLPFVREVELEFDQLRSDVPLTEPYQQLHEGRRSLGRFSVRVHVDDTRDPLEVAYVLAGVRIATSQERGRLTLGWDFSESLRFELRAETLYDTDVHHLRADLAYRWSPMTSLHLAAGDGMVFLSTPSIYSMYESPMDGSPGLVLYAVHLF